LSRCPCQKDRGVKSAVRKTGGGKKGRERDLQYDAACRQEDASKCRVKNPMPKKKIGRAGNGPLKGIIEKERNGEKMQKSRNIG